METETLRKTTLCFLKLYLSYQVFDSVRPVIPLRRAELISTLHYHPQHQHLFAVPEWWRASQ